MQSRDAARVHSVPRSAASLHPAGLQVLTEPLTDPPPGLTEPPPGLTDPPPGLTESEPAAPAAAPATHPHAVTYTRGFSGAQC